MDEHTNILLMVLEWAWVGLFAVIAWMIRKIIKVEDDCSTERAQTTTDVAVLKNSQAGLRSEFDKEMKRNNIDHQKILDRIDTHHDRVMSRLDSLVKFAKSNGK